MLIHRLWKPTLSEHICFVVRMMRHSRELYHVSASVFKFFLYDAHTAPFPSPLPSCVSALRAMGRVKSLFAPNFEASCRLASGLSMAMVIESEVHLLSRVLKCLESWV